MKFLFLQPDYDLFAQHVEGIRTQHKAAGKSLGEACAQGAETFHDNAPFDAAMDEFQLTALRLGDLQQIVRYAQIVQPATSTDEVGIGSLVHILSVTDDRAHWYRIGSYVVQNSGGEGEYEDEPIITSYRSPIGKGAFRKKAGEHFFLPDRKEMIVMEIL